MTISKTEWTKKKKTHPHPHYWQYRNIQLCCGRLTQCWMQWNNRKVDKTLSLQKNDNVPFTWFKSRLFQPSPTGANLLPEKTWVRDFLDVNACASRSLPTTPWKRKKMEQDFQYFTPYNLHRIPALSCSGPIFDNLIFKANDQLKNQTSQVILIYSNLP